MSNDVEGLINALGQGNNAEANTIFSDIMADRMRDHLDAKKIEIGSQLYSNEVSSEVDLDSAEEIVGEEPGEDV
jgi:hypothetical protein